MSITNILPICVWCDVPKMHNKAKSINEAIKDMPRIEITTVDGDIHFKCEKCGEGQWIQMKDGKRFFNMRTS